jgi:hypothetical protein
VNDCGFHGFVLINGLVVRVEGVWGCEGKLMKVTGSGSRIPFVFPAGERDFLTNMGHRGTGILPPKRVVFSESIEWVWEVRSTRRKALVGSVEVIMVRAGLLEEGLSKVLSLWA